MERRSFISSLIAAPLLAKEAFGGALGPQAPSPDTDSPPQIYLWRQYILKTGTQPRRVADFLQNAAIPALNRLGHKPIGAFEAVSGVATPTVFTLTPFASLEEIGTLETRLDADKEFASAGAAYLDAPATDVPYVRQEVSLLVAFPKFPKLVVQAATGTKGPRLFELRTYESPTERAHRAKVKMFSEMGEIDIFHRAGLTPVFFSRTFAGPKMPSLTYMLVHENMAARDKNWSAFSRDTEWRKLSQTPAIRIPRSSRTSPSCTSGRPPTLRYRLPPRTTGDQEVVSPYDLLTSCEALCGTGHSRPSSG
jgi:hypothetical protein